MPNSDIRGYYPEPLTAAHAVEIERIRSRFRSISLEPTSDEDYDVPEVSKEELEILVAQKLTSCGFDIEQRINPETVLAAIRMVITDERHQGNTVDKNADTLGKSFGQWYD
jgi:hypothetical protein